jgi:hypothetical protein
MKKLIANQWDNRDEKIINLLQAFHPTLGSHKLLQNLWSLPMSFILFLKRSWTFDDVTSTIVEINITCNEIL